MFCVLNMVIWFWHDLWNTNDVKPLFVYHITDYAISVDQCFVKLPLAAYGSYLYRCWYCDIFLHHWQTDRYWDSQPDSAAMGGTHLEKKLVASWLLDFFLSLSLWVGWQGRSHLYLITNTNIQGVTPMEPASHKIVTMSLYHTYSIKWPCSTL